MLARLIKLRLLNITLLIIILSLAPVSIGPNTIRSSLELYSESEMVILSNSIFLIELSDPEVLYMFKKLIDQFEIVRVLNKISPSVSIFIFLRNKRG